MQKNVSGSGLKTGRDGEPLAQTRLVEPRALPPGVDAVDQARLLLVLDHAHEIGRNTYFPPNTVNRDAINPAVQFTVVPKLAEAGYYDVTVSLAPNVVVERDQLDAIFAVDPERIVGPTARFNLGTSRVEIQLRLYGLAHLPPRQTTHRQIVTLYQTAARSEPVAAAGGRRFVRVPTRDPASGALTLHQQQAQVDHYGGLGAGIQAMASFVGRFAGLGAGSSQNPSDFH